MNIYKANFYRLNFDFRPPLRQESDVVFETDIPFTDENINEFEETMWNAVWEQNPHWKNEKKILGGITGWSSVLGGNRVVKVELAKLGEQHA